ncbi:PBSX family phage terminase large subunit [Latilactobacillus sakei]
MQTWLTDIHYSEKQAGFIFSSFDHTFEVNEGSIRSGKTAADDARLALLYMLSPDKLHLVSAYNQELAYNLFIEGDGLGLAYIFDGISSLRRDRGGDHLAIDLPNGTKKIYFKGGGKSNSANSIRGLSLGSVAYSEMNLLDAEFINETFRRTAASKLRYHLGDLNPPAPQDKIIKVFEERNAHWMHWTMKDNPIMTPQRLAEMKHELSGNPYLYRRDWLGERVMPQGVIYSMLDVERDTDQTLIGKPIEMFFSGDAGQNDATTMSCNIVTLVREDNGNKLVLNRVANYYHSGTESNETKAMSQYAVELKAFIDWCVNEYQMRYTTVLIDPAAKVLRAELELLDVDCERANNNGHEKVGAVKGIEVGIERMQNLMSNGQFKLVEVHHEPEGRSYGHYHFIKEIGSYVRDEKTGHPVDANNHAQDENRYAGNYFYSNYLT